MGLFSLDTVLGLLTKVPAVLAQASEFKTIFDQIVSTFDDDTDQETLKSAYELAVEGSEQAHSDLQTLVRERTS